MLFLVPCLVAVTPLFALALDIGACGQSVPRTDVGELRADLVCPRGAVILASGASLNLNGFTLTGTGAGTGVECTSGRGCSVNGPGAIVGFEAGLSGAGRVSVTGIAVRGNDVGFTTKGGTFTLTGAVANENRVGVQVVAGRLRVDGFEASGNSEAGIQTTASQVRLTSLVARGNGGLGGVYVTTPRGGTVKIRSSTILDNDGLFAGYDVITTGRAKLVATVCGRGARVRESRTSPKARTVIGSLGCQDD
jgi:hypothetical protein